MDDLVAVLTILVGNGALIAIVTWLLNYYTKRTENRLAARKESHDFYKELYGKIAYLEKLVLPFSSSQTFKIAEIAPDKKNTLFIKNKGLIDINASELEAYYRAAFDDARSYYMDKCCSGFGIYIPEQLQNMIENFFNSTHQGVHNYKAAHNLVKEIKSEMESLFGLK